MDRTAAARDIVSASASRLCLDMRFLTRAVLSLSTDVEEGEGAPRCDGRTVTFRADTVLESFREDPNSVTRDLAHCVLHCVLGHTSPANTPETDLAEDMLVEYVLDCLDTPHTSVPGRDDRVFVCERLFGKAGAPAVDLLSAVVAETSRWQLDLHRRMFVRDDHSARSGTDDATWRELSQQVMAEVEGFVRDDEGRTTALMHILRIRNRRRYDYRSFLRKFMTRRTTVRESQTEFDPIYYTYGLSRYGNLPLIDSLEQSDTAMVDEFVIAVDTSGSTMRGPVVRFLEEAFDVLRQTGVDRRGQGVQPPRDPVRRPGQVGRRGEERGGPEEAGEGVRAEGRREHRLQAGVRLRGPAHRGGRVQEPEGPDVLHRRAGHVPHQAPGLRRGVRVLRRQIHGARGAALGHEDRGQDGGPHGGCAHGFPGSVTLTFLTGSHR